MILNIFEFISIPIHFHCSMGSWKLNIWIKSEKKYFSQEGNINWCMLWRAFLCRNRIFCVKPCILLSKPGFLCRTSVIILFEPLGATIPKIWGKIQRDKTELVFVKYRPQNIDYAGASISRGSHNVATDNRRMCLQMKVYQLCMSRILASQAADILWYNLIMAFLELGAR